MFIATGNILDTVPPALRDRMEVMRFAREYTREAGVRNMEREMGAICRKVATEVARGSEKPVKVTIGNLHKYLGPPPGPGGGLLPAAGRAHPRPRGGGPQGRAVGRDHDGRGPGFGPDGPHREARRGHDRRDHAARPRPAHRRAEGEGPGGAPRRHADGHPAEGE